MKISCDVVKDLLPLYHDEVCSLESKKLVEAHLETCESCKEELEKYNIDLKIGNQNSDSGLDGAKAISKLSNKWKQDKRRSFLLGTMLVSILGCIFSIYSYNAAGSYVAEDGTLVEAFGFIPLAFLFAFIAFVSIITFGISSIRKFKG
tara:strand:- start:313 stop:756 length:444 start_codon:yes stop_codon:yes gene_type:complete